MVRILDFPMHLRRLRNLAAQPVPSPAPPADGGAAPGKANAPGLPGAATIHDLTAAIRRRRAHDPIGTAGMLATAGAIVAISAAFLCAHAVLAQARAQCDRW